MSTRVEDGKAPRFEGGGILPITVGGATLVTGGGAYGAYVELSADIGNKDIYLHELVFHHTEIMPYGIKIAIGAGGSEIDITEVHTRIITTYELVKHVSLGNIRIPANSRLSACGYNTSGTTESAKINVAHNY